MLKGLGNIHTHSYSLALLWLPFRLLFRTFADDIPSILRIRLYLKPMRAEVAFTPECVYRRRVVVPYFPLLGVVAYTLADMLIATATPYVERKFKSYN